MDIHETLAALRAQFPEDVDQINKEQERVSALLEEQEYYENPLTQKLIALCRRDVVNARKKLAIERKLTDEARADLWHIIDAREWFLKMVAKDYASELEQIGSELEAELHR